ncbi:hypothetical protein [Nocardiopsis potens]|uniref:hypothetical protein n=1 Tax=Nocardiopsis potens TaxID=1246458 RepID=UPI000347E0D4|nr:hypothetical protein [Nocardiopsis potens]
MPRENIVPFLVLVVLPWAVAAAVVAGAVAGNAWIVQRIYFPEEHPWEYSGRAEAVVIGREERGGGGPAPPAVTVYVEYEPEGRGPVSGAELRGDDAMAYLEGDALIVAYHPDSPEIPFTLGALERPGPVTEVGAVASALLFGALACWVAPAWAAEVSDLRTRWWTRRLPGRRGGAERGRSGPGGPRGR